MQFRFTALTLATSILFVFSTHAWAWGRHDLITQLAIDNPAFAHLNKTIVTPEPIEKAAPDLLKRVIPGVERWCERYHREHDTRYSWSIPPERRELNPREALLWALEDNTDTKLPIGNERTAAEILIRYSAEPDGMLDEGLEKSPYVERLGPSMSLFKSNDAHTHAFRHYYVPSSLFPPILEPKGTAPYRADLYAHLAAGAFATGHPYWGYRFLAWSLHYIQDVTQPWHTVFLPGISFLSFSKSEMKHEIQALHYLTEAFADTWIHQLIQQRLHSIEPRRMLASYSLSSFGSRNPDPWYVSKLAEGFASDAHAQASELANASRDFFKPVVQRLGPDLKLTGTTLDWGGLQLASAKLDFSGQGEGATNFLQPIWSSGFRLAAERDRLIGDITGQIKAAIHASRMLLKQSSH